MTQTRWDVAVAYPAGPVTVGYTVDDSEAWEVSAAYAAGAVAAELTYAQRTKCTTSKVLTTCGNGASCIRWHVGIRLMTSTSALHTPRWWCICIRFLRQDTALQMQT